jgi:uncharacterized membrane protein YkoI
MVATMRSPLPLAAAFLTLLASVAAADDDHDRARDALRRGEIQPLEEILAEVRRQRLGTVLEVELERRRGRWVYEVETLSADGLVAKFWLDAASRQILDRGELGREGD